MFMANPAELLYNLFSQWDNPSSPPYRQRDDDASLTDHRLALITIQSQRKDTWQKVLDDFVFPYIIGSLPSAALVTGGVINAITS